MGASAGSGTDKEIKTGFTKMKLFFIYLIIINLFSAGFFIFDKKSAERNGRRIPEITLHLLELLGGVFATLILMYVIKHKNRKFKYYIFTYLILILWVAVFLMIRFELYRLANL